MTLSEGICEKSYTVKNIVLAPDAKRRFEILGLTQNSEVKILGKKKSGADKSGAMIIKIRGTRFAVGAAFAQGIEVEPKEDEDRNTKNKSAKENGGNKQ